MNNFDHIDRSSSSGKNDNHDSVLVLFQNKCSRTLNQKKGKVSNLGITSTGRKIHRRYTILPKNYHHVGLHEKISRYQKTSDPIHLLMRPAMLKSCCH